MARIVHIALKVEDLERSTRFYEDVFGIRQTKTSRTRGHVSRHLTDGGIDLALMVYDSEDDKEAKLMGSGPCIHHWGIEVEDRAATIKKIEENGGTLISDAEEGALKFRAPDGTLAEIVAPGRYKTRERNEKARINHIALKVPDLEQATRFYETVFGFKQKKTVQKKGRVTRHFSDDGDMDMTLMVYESEEAKDATLSGAGPRIHHVGIEVADRPAFATLVEQHGGAIVSRPEGKGAIKFRTPDGTIAELTSIGSFAKKPEYA